MSHLAPCTFRFRLLILGAAVFMFLPVTLNALQRETTRTRRDVTPANTPTPTPQPPPPVVDFQVVPDREKAEPGDEIQVAVFISNKSSQTLSRLRINFDDSNFKLVRNAALPESLPAYRSVSEHLVLTPAEGSGFGTRKLLLLMEYAWHAQGAEFVSTQPATASVSIARRFEEETKGFPGGTAAFFYLLLPIIPAILSYQFFNGLRKGEGPKIPAFKTEYIVPAFFAAVVLSLLMLVAFKLDAGLDYSNPLVFLGVLLGSMVVGASLAFSFWGRDLWQKHRWGFNNSDSLESYARKALLAPWAPREFEWAQGTVDQDAWAGVRLRQPDGSTVLGAVLQVSYRQKASESQWEALLKEVVDQEGAVIDRKRLVRMVQAKELALKFAGRISHAGQPVAQVVVIDEVKNWKRAGGQTGPLIRPFR